MGAGVDRPHGGCMLTSSTTPRLVAGVDASDDAPKVVAVAAALAQQLDLELQLVHSVRADVRLTGLRPNSLAAGRELLRWLDPTNLASAHVVDDRPAARLLVAASQDAALVVVGSRDRGRLRKALFGSVSERVARDARAPVVVVPSASFSEGWLPRVVVCGVDASDRAASALETAARLTAALGSDLEIVHAGDYDDSFRATGLISEAAEARSEVVGRAIARARVDLSTLPTSMHLATGQPAAELAAAASRHSAESLIVVGSSGHGRLREAARTSTSSVLTSIARVPVVIVPTGASTPPVLHPRHTFGSQPAHAGREG